MMHDRKTVAVFGSSEPAEGDSLYETAYELGKLLAAKGFDICTGGYGGVMEAASKGAREKGGGAVGVTVGMFSARIPNPYISEHFHENDLYGRTKRLIEVSDAFIILHGKSGTLSELTFLWALHRGGELGDKPIILLGDFWKKLLSSLKEAKLIGAEQLQVTKVSPSPAQAVEEITKYL
jgi:uncharacterized protein (TIGR00730 family)